MGNCSVPWITNWNKSSCHVHCPLVIFLVLNTSKPSAVHWMCSAKSTDFKINLNKWGLEKGSCKKNSFLLFFAKPTPSSCWCSGSNSASSILCGCWEWNVSPSLAPTELTARCTPHTWMGLWGSASGKWSWASSAPGCISSEFHHWAHGPRAWRRSSHAPSARGCRPWWRRWARERSRWPSAGRHHSPAEGRAPLSTTATAPHRAFLHCQVQWNTHSSLSDLVSLHGVNQLHNTPAHMELQGKQGLWTFPCEKK